MLPMVLGLDSKALHATISIDFASSDGGASRRHTSFFTASQFDLATTLSETFSFRLKMKA